MIIWQRWGFLVVLCAGLGALSGFGLNAVIDPAGMAAGNSDLFGGIGLILGAVYCALLVHLVILPRLDRPRPVLHRRELPQPIPGPGGSLQTHEVFQAVDPQTGTPMTYRPRSSLFFIPVRYWPFVLGAIGLVVVAVAIVRTLVG